jgi:hypothetical protein
MTALITLTPSESKKLIAQSVLALPEFQKARQNGTIALHPCSSTYFIFEALTGRKPEGVWARGIIIPRGLCISQAERRPAAAQAPGPHDPRQIRHTWLFRNGLLQEPLSIGEILDQLTENDVYIKGSNAVDPAGNVAVLFGNPAGGGGTIGRVITAQRRTGFHLLLPIGLEKLIPVPIATATKKVTFGKVDRAMGIPCGLIHVPGKKIDEVDALAILSGAKATPIAAGGLGGAEGSIVLAISGTDEQVRKVFEISSSVKGTTLPAPRILDCDACRRPGCHLSPDWSGR